MKTKKTILIAIIAILAFAFTACGNTEQDTVKPTDKKSESVITSQLDKDKDSKVKEDKKDKKDEKKEDKTDSKKDADSKKSDISDKKTDTKSANKKSDAKKPSNNGSVNQSSVEASNENVSNKPSNQPSAGSSNNNSSNKPSQPSTGNSGNSNNNGNSGNSGNTGNNGNSGNNSGGNGGSNKPKPPHQHNYTSSITSQPSCTNAGQKTYACACGHSYTESIGAKDHAWQAHVEKGHNEDYIIKAAWSEPVYQNQVVCNQCNANFGQSADAAIDHVVWSDTCKNYRTEKVQIDTKYHDAEYGTRYVVDSPAYTSCNACGTYQ